ncbi:HRDC-like protein [Lipomyces oligophaga]|uniref:HRDC-like protein n=1 Tax=Lipomyces oligophaga TaxID=45792 RepID=UPI0034CDAB8E
MKIENPREKLLCNAEVFRHLSEIKQKQKQLASRKTSALNNENLETVALEIQRYMSNTTFSVASQQTDSDIYNFLSEISVFELEKAEKLQIVNQSPSSLALLCSLVEEFEQRFTEQDGNNMLQLVAKYLHPVSN